MSLLNQHIAELQEKLQTLLKAYRQLELENQRLEKELTDLRQLQIAIPMPCLHWNKNWLLPESPVATGTLRKNLNCRNR